LSRGAGRDPLEIMTDAAHFGETKPSGLSAPLTSPPVIAGLDPAIHRFERIAFSMDARVKPAHDGSRTATQAAPHFAKRSQQARAAGAGFCEDAEPRHEPFQGCTGVLFLSCYALLSNGGRRHQMGARLRPFPVLIP